MARPNERDRYKYGICTNRDKNGEGTPCPKCESKEVQQVRAGQDFACDECKEPLRMVPPPKSTKSPLTYIIIAVVVLACAGGIGFYLWDRTPAEVDLISLTFKETPQDMELKKDEAKQLNLILNPGDASELITWTSGDEAVATVSAAGLVTAVGAGEVTITAEADRSHVKAEITVVVSDEDGSEASADTLVVNEVNLIGLTFKETPKDMKLKKNDVKQLNLNCNPEDSNELITWTSGNEAVATVSADGIVTAVGVGKTAITAESDRSHTKAQMEVVVSDTEVAVSSGIVTKNLGYAVYKGRMKNGLMNDDNGVLTFTSTHIIEPRDVKKREAKAGEKVIGIFENGHLTTGTWYKSDGNKEVIIP